MVKIEHWIKLGYGQVMCFVYCNGNLMAEYRKTFKIKYVHTQASSFNMYIRKWQKCYIVPDFLLSAKIYRGEKLKYNYFIFLDMNILLNCFFEIFWMLKSLFLSGPEPEI